MLPLLTLFAFLAVTVEGDSPDRWPSFLGLGHGPIQSQTVPIAWSPTERIAWKIPLVGKGQSSPVVWGDSVYVTSIEGSMKEKCHLHAIAISTGEMRWTKTFSASQTVRSNYFQSRSAPTPVVDEKQVIAFYETGNLVAVNHAGDVLWERSLTDEYGVIESTIGLAASPVQTDDSVILLVDHEGPSYLVSIDKETGKTNWKVDRESRVSYASPAIAAIAGQTHVVCSSTGSIDGYDSESGEQLWSLGDLGGNSQNTPLSFGEGYFLVGASPGMHNEREAVARESNLCLQVVKTDSGYEPKVIWKNRKALTTFASPIAYQGYAYWVTKAGILHCFDLKNGEEKYEKRLAQQCWATPFAVDDRIYFFGKDGSTSVIQAGPEFRLLAENQLWDPSLAPPTSPGSFGGRPSHEHGGAERGNPTTEDVAKATAKEADGDGERGRSPTDEKAVRSPERSGGPPLSEAEREAARAQGENRFADPVQYGYAITSQGIIIRTGEVVYCVR